VVVYYGDHRLAGLTFNSVDNLRGFIAKLMKNVPNSGVIVKIGDGSPKLCKLLADMIAETISPVRIEIVDEKGTSVSGPGSGGLARDQNAAARIALRKGVLYRTR
jgi:nucleoside-diphosphate-sugar epimerase